MLGKKEQSTQNACRCFHCLDDFVNKLENNAPKVLLLGGCSMVQYRKDLNRVCVQVRSNSEIYQRLKSETPSFRGAKRRQICVKETFTQTGSDLKMRKPFCNNKAGRQ